jgi:O-acetylserine/cysteine efflux transporter
MTAIDILTLLLVTLVWGFNFAVVKIGLAQLPPILFVSLRFFLVAALLLPFLKWPRHKRGLILLLAITLGVIHFSMFFLGVSGLEVSTAAIAIQLQVPFASILAAIVYRDRLGWRRLLGMAFAFAGVALVAGAPRSNPAIGPLLLVIGAACFWSIASMIMKEIGDELDVLSLNGWVAVIAAPLLLAVSAIFEHGHVGAILASDWRAWLSLLFQACLVTLFGYSVWYRMMRRFSLNQVMPFTLLVPVFGVLSGVIFLGDRVTQLMLLGAALTIVGIGIIVLRRPRIAAQATKGGL